MEYICKYTSTTYQLKQFYLKSISSMFMFTTCSGVWKGRITFANSDTHAAEDPFKQACWKCIELNCCIASAISCPTVVVPSVCTMYVSWVRGFLSLAWMVLCFRLISSFLSIFANAFWNSSGITLSIIASLWAVRCSRQSLSGKLVHTFSTIVYLLL